MQGHLFKKVIFSAIVTTLLVAVSWVLGDWSSLKFGAMAIVEDYFQNAYRIFFLVYIWVEGGVADTILTMRTKRPVNEILHDWHHWQDGMWETIMVISVFSDARGILGLNADQTVRASGALFISVGFMIYLAAVINQKRELKQNPLLLFPTNGIYRWIRFPEHLSSVLTGFGIALIFNAWAGIFASFLYTFLMIKDVLKQDRKMGSKYGEPWLMYQGRVSRWIPMVW